MRYLILLALLTIATACTTDAPRLTRVNGHTTAQTDKRFLGMKVWTSSTDIKTKEQKLDDMEIEKDRREMDQDLVAEERQTAAAFWFGSFCLAAAAVCVVAGYVLHGWKFWGGLAFVAGSMGVIAWSFEHLIPHLKWVGYFGAAAAIGWTMWKLQHFDVIKHLKERRKVKNGE